MGICGLKNEVALSSRRSFSECFLCLYEHLSNLPLDALVCADPRCTLKEKNLGGEGY